MIEGTIKIVATKEAWEDDYCAFTVTIAKSEIKSTSCFYTAVNAWKDFGEQLMNFPASPTASVLFESGGSSVYGNNLLLKAQCYDSQGHAALRVLADNKEEEPHQRRFDFSIMAEVASINYLGRLLAGRATAPKYFVYQSFVFSLIWHLTIVD